MIEVHLATGGRDVDADRLTRAAEAAARARGVEAAELSITLLDDAAMREMNARHLGHDRVTDVISFALGEAGGAGLVGDVYVGAEQAARQAAAAGIDHGEELVRLVIHGALHVTGMDHPEGPADRAASEMYRLQERLVAELDRRPADGSTAPAPESE